jgi:carboxypeptidase Q
LSPLRAPISYRNSYIANSRRKAIMDIESAVRRSLLALAWSVFPLWTLAQQPTPKPVDTATALEAVVGKGMMENHAYQFLEELTDRIGGRVTGTPQASQAINWGLDRMKAIGLENVHRENWSLFKGWSRVAATAELLGPRHHSLAIDSFGWVGSTPEAGVEGDLVLVDRSHLDEEIREKSSGWAGKILITIVKGQPPDPTYVEMARFGRFVDAAGAAKAVAVIAGRVGGRPSGTYASVVDPKYHDLPVVSIAWEDQQLLVRLLEHADSLRLRINVQNRPTPGSVQTANVIGEITGREHPEQVVVVGAHLDSWDLAQGATDNGNGVAAVLGAAEALVGAGFRPRRTIRFALFTGEEQGLLGSFAYTRSHNRELLNHVAAVVMDWGDGPATALNLGGHDDLIPDVAAFAKTVKSFGDLKVDDRTEFGTDSGPFILAGLPGISIYQESPDLADVTHTTADTFDKVKQDVLIRNSVLMALLSFWIADRPNRLASPWSPEESSRMLKRKGTQTVQDLKALGWWPFGDLDSPPEPNNP